MEAGLKLFTLKTTQQLFHLHVTSLLTKRAGLPTPQDLLPSITKRQISCLLSWHDFHKLREKNVSVMFHKEKKIVDFKIKAHINRSY